MAKRESTIRIFDCTHHIHTCLMHANGKKMLLIIAQVILVLAANRKSSNGIYYKRVFYIVTLKTLARSLTHTLPLSLSVCVFLNRAVPKESVRQLSCKWTCLTNFRLRIQPAFIHTLTSSSTLPKEWCYIFISVPTHFFVFEGSKKWKRKIHLDLLHILL